jgi:hypothetical protein
VHICARPLSEQRRLALPPGTCRFQASCCHHSSKLHHHHLPVRLPEATLARQAPHTTTKCVLCPCSPRTTSTSIPSRNMPASRELLPAPQHAPLLTSRTVRLSHQRPHSQDKHHTPLPSSVCYVPIFPSNNFDQHPLQGHASLAISAVSTPAAPPLTLQPMRLSHLEAALARRAPRIPTKQQTSRTQGQHLQQSPHLHEPHRHRHRRSPPQCVPNTFVSPTSIKKISRGFFRAFLGRGREMQQRQHRRPQQRGTCRSNSAWPY